MVRFGTSVIDLLIILMKESSSFYLNIESLL